MEMRRLRGNIICCWILATAFLADSQNTSNETETFPEIKSWKKKNKDQSQCPTTCQLKRRIGKLQNYIQLRFVDILANFESINQSQAERSSIWSPSSHNVKPMRVEVQANDTEYQPEVEALPAEVTDQFSNPSITSSSEYRDVLVAMNSTIRQLTRQNNLLQREAKDARDLSDVVREQNHILASQNRGLRLHANNVDVRIRQFRSQIEALEEAVTYLNQTRYSENNRFQQSNEVSESAKQNELDLADAEKRITGLEEWIRIASESGSIPPIPTTTSHPQPDTPPTDCQELLQMGYTTSGVYTIHPWRAPNSFDVYCEQEYYGGGWTFIQRRRDGSVDFDRNWDDYESGFGDLGGEFWLGNSKIHQLTNQNTYRLHVVLQDWNNERAYAEYDGFKVSSARDYYSVRFGRYQGTAGDGLRGQSVDGSTNIYLSRFGTHDSDNDSCTPCLYEGEVFENCARYYNGGWWFRACADSNLNGNYITPGNHTSCAGGNCFGIRWRTWKQEEEDSLKASVMMVKLVETGEEN